MFTTKQLQLTPLFFKLLTLSLCHFNIFPHVHVLVCLHFERWRTACQEYIVTSQYFPIGHGHFRPNLSPASEKTANHYRKAQTGTDLPQYFHFLLLVSFVFSSSSSNIDDSHERSNDAVSDSSRDSIVLACCLSDSALFTHICDVMDVASILTGSG